MNYFSANSLLALSFISMTACVSAAQENEGSQNSFDEIMGFIPWQELEINQQESVSIYQLIVDGEKFDNQYVQVQGFLRYKIENNAAVEHRLYVDKDSYDYHIWENSIDVGERLPECSGPLEALDGEFLIMRGVFRQSRSMLSPIDHIRLIKINEISREIETNEILCKDNSLVVRLKSMEEGGE